MTIMIDGYNTILSLPRDQLITLTVGQLLDLVTQATQAAIEPLQARVEAMEATTAEQDEKMADMTGRLTSLESIEEQDITRIYCDIAQDRQRIAKLERTEPQPMQRDRAEILHALLAANGGKMLAKDARKKMHLSKNRFSELLGNCDFVETKPYHLDRRQVVIILNSELVPRN